MRPNHTRDKETFSTALHGVASKRTPLHNLGYTQKAEGCEWTDDGERYRMFKNSALPTQFMQVYIAKQIRLLQTNLLLQDTSHYRYHSRIQSYTTFYSFGNVDTAVTKKKYCYFREPNPGRPVCKP